MRIIILAAASFSLFLFTSCNNENQQETGKSENNIDAARNFSYAKNDQSVKDGYRSASINIHKVNKLNDSTTVIIYSNSYKNDHDTLKVLKVSNQWLVDLKYLFEHDADTLTVKPLTNDTLK